VRARQRRFSAGQDISHFLFRSAGFESAVGVIAIPKPSATRRSDSSALPSSLFDLHPSKRERTLVLSNDLTEPHR
jgi:hypothetical protein